MPLRTSLYRKPASSGVWPRRTQRRREVLSVNMISLPLADFRHVSHIGSDAHAESFGDLSFLRGGHGLLLQSSQSEQNLFQACPSPPPPKPPRLNLDEPPEKESPPWCGGRRKKKCSSLPLLDSEPEADEEACPREGGGPGHGPGRGHSYSPGRGSLSSGRDGDSTATCPEDETDSGFSFSLDLGPSILDDVLRVMDRHQH